MFACFGKVIERINSDNQIKDMALNKLINIQLINSK